MALHFLYRAIRLSTAPAVSAALAASATFVVPAAPRFFRTERSRRTLRRVDGMLLIVTFLFLGGCDGTAGREDLRQVSESGFGAYEVALAPRADQLAVAWYDTRDGNAEIYLRLLNNADIGGSVGRAETRGAREYRLTDSATDSYEASIDALPRGFAVAWYEKSSAEHLDAQLGLWTPERGFEWRRALSTVPGAESRNPVVAVAVDRIFCAWIEKAADGSEAVRGGWFAAADGTPLEDSVRLGPASPTTWNLNAAIDAASAAGAEAAAVGKSVPVDESVSIDGTSAVVVYDAETETKAAELFAAELQGGRATLRQLTDDDGHASKYPDLAFGKEGLALTWFDERDGNQEVYLYIGADFFPGAGAGTSALNKTSARNSTSAGTSTSAGNGIRLGARAEFLDRAARRVTRTPGRSIGAYVAYAAGRYGLAWSDDSEGSYDVYFQSFRAADGVPEAPIRRLTTTSTASLIPAIRPYGDGFTIAWTEVTRPGQGLHDAAARAEILLSAVR